MQVISAETVHRLCSFPELMDALEASHREPPADLKDTLLSSPRDDDGTDDKIMIRAAWAHGSALGLKAATIFPRNLEEFALPAIHAQFLLFDGKTGVPTALIDGTALTYYKTAADSALGARHLARPNASSMAMIGAGAMAPYLIRAHCCARESIRTVSIWNRTASKAKAIADTLNLPGVEINVAHSLEAAVRNCDVVCAATMTQEPIIRGQWLQPGTHLDLVGAFTPQMREADDEAVCISRIFVDSRFTTIGEIGEIEIPLQTGIIEKSDIVGDLFELCSRRVLGRETENEITLFKNGGGGHLDLMTARHIISVANSTP